MRCRCDEKYFEALFHRSKSWTISRGSCSTEITGHSLSDNRIEKKKKQKKNVISLAQKFLSYGYILFTKHSKPVNTIKLCLLSLGLLEPDREAGQHGHKTQTLHEPKAILEQQWDLGLTFPEILSCNTGQTISFSWASIFCLCRTKTVMLCTLKLSGMRLVHEL